MVIINKSSTYLDLSAMLTIHDSIGDVLDQAIPKRKKRSDAGKKRKTSSKSGTAAKAKSKSPKSK
jgi:NAD-dependent deacetylase